jgi:hypothetical protein
MALLKTEYQVAAPCFLEAAPQPGDPENLFEPVRQAQARLLEAARSALRLRDVAGTGYFDRSTSWRDLRNAFTVSTEQNGAAD